MRGTMAIMAGASLVAMAGGFYAIYALWQIAPDAPRVAGSVQPAKIAIGAPTPSVPGDVPASRIPSDAPASGVADGVQPVPAIVTYELGLAHEADRAVRRDPRQFWIRQIVARLEEKKSAGTIGLKEPATAQVSFTIGRDGTLVSKTIAKASGIPDVDKEALSILDRAQPFPPMPAAMSEEALSFNLPLRFR